MARYVDCFIIPVPKKNIKSYKELAKISAKTWKKCGALEYVETLADDAPKGKITSFPRSVKLKPSETVVLGYAVYKSLAHREKVVAKVMNDEKLMKAWDQMPFDGMRMIYGGFQSFINT